jgi:hypothetical protein
VAKALSEEEVKRLLRELQSKKAYRRRQAAETLGQVEPGNERVTASLATVASNDPNRYVRAAARHALFTLQDASVAVEAPPPAPPPARGFRNRRNRLDFMVGFISWFLLNGLAWFLLVRFADYPSGIIEFEMIPLTLLANVGTVLILIFVRRWLGLGMIAALALSLLSLLSMIDGI